MDTLAGTLMRIFVDDTDRSGHQPLYMAIVEELRIAGFAGATVFKGIEGYGSRKELHAARSFDISTTLPVLIEVVETQELIEHIIPRLRELISEGLITLERINMIPLRRETPAP